MKTVLLTAAALFAGFAFTTGAGAYEPAHSGAQVSVRYDDLNLSNPAGAKALLKRLERAAERLCGHRPDLRFIDRRRIFRQCVEPAVADAVERLDAPLVTALHAGESLPRVAVGDSD